MRVVGGVQQDGGAAPDDLQPARGADAGEALADLVGVELPAAGAADAEERLDGGQREGRVLGLVLAVQRQEDVLVLLAADPAQRHQLAADREFAADDAELHALAGDRGVHLDRAPQDGLGGVELLLGDDRDGVGLDDPGLLDGDLAGGLPQLVGVVEADRGDHGDPGVDDVGGVPGAAHADLDHGDVHRRVGEGRVGHAGEHLEEGHRDRLALVDHPHVGLDVAVDLDEPLGGDRGAVQADPLGDALHVRAGVAAGAQLEDGEQLLDHPGGGGLAVGAGDVDGGEGPLGLAQDVHQGLDPVERGLQLVLRPALGEFHLDVAQGVGGAAVGGAEGVRVRVGLVAHVHSLRSPGRLSRRGENHHFARVGRFPRLLSSSRHQTAKKH